MPTTYMTDSEKVKLYEDRVRKGQNAFDRWAPDARARIARYKNDPDADAFTITGHRINTPTGTAIIDSLYSSLTAVDIEVNVTPRAHATAENARVAEQAIMGVWREAKVPAKSREAVKDALIVGIGWVKVGYDYAEHDEVQPKSTEELDAELGDYYNTLTTAGVTPQDNRWPTAEEAVADVGTTKEVKIVDRDRVTVDYVPWDHIGWNSEARKYSDIRYIYQLTRLPIEEIKGNPAWREYVKKHGPSKSYKDIDELKPDSRIDTNEPGTIGIDGDVNAESDDGRITIVEFHNLVAGTICTFAKGTKFLLYETASPHAFQEDLEDRNPFIPCILRTNPTSVRGISDMELIIPSLNELNRYRSKLINHLERHVPKIIGPGRSISTEGKEALLSKEPAFVPLEETATASDLQILQPPPLLEEMFKMDARIENQIREATGVSELMRGIFPDRKRTATETAEVVAASSARQSEKRTLMEEFYTNIARRILVLLQVYGEDQVARLAELEGDVDWQWSAEDITMEADLEIVLAPRQPRDAAWREERAMKLINLVAPLPEAKRTNLIVLALKDMGYTMQEIREVVKLEDEQKAEEAEQIATEAVAAWTTAEAQALGAASGDPNIPGGASTEAGLTPEVAEAAAMGGAGGQASTFLAGP